MERAATEWEFFGTIGLVIVLLILLCYSCYEQGRLAGQWHKKKEIDQAIKNAFSSKVRHYSKPIRLSEFALEHKMPGDKATQWLDDRVKEFSGIKEITPSGDYLYYFGEAADKKAEEQMKLLDEA